MKRLFTGILAGLVAVVVVLWPQPGYIHPDEFFQSTEIVAGDIFNITHLRTWEFRADMPLRDITLPYLLFAPGFLLLRAALSAPHPLQEPSPHPYIQETSPHTSPPTEKLSPNTPPPTEKLSPNTPPTTKKLSPNTPPTTEKLSPNTPPTTEKLSPNTPPTTEKSTLPSTPETSPNLHPFSFESYALLVIPRLILAVAGIINYWFVRELCVVFKVNTATAFYLWCTSYVTWTFLTRSFSNTSETLLLSVAGLVILHILQRCKTVKPEKDEKVSWYVVLTSTLLGVVVCLGFFNRPTFLFFILAPLLWFMDELRCVCKTTLTVVIVCCSGLGFLVTFVMMSVINSLYYNPQFSHLLTDVCSAMLHRERVLESVHSMIGGLRIPPWSFIHYNLLSVNLADHGLHPWYTHLVNLTMLLGPLALVFYWDLISMVTHCRQKHATDALYVMVFSPVLCLSFFPHQEARFLLPILPLAVVAVAKNRAVTWKSVKVVALLFNMSGLVMFGWLHQGGVTPALSMMQGRLKQEAADWSNVGAHYHIVSYVTYMPPRHILFANTSTIQVHVHDMTGAHNRPAVLTHRVQEIKSSCVKQSTACFFWLLLPAPALTDLMHIQGWQLRQQAEFCPHVSMERPPDIVGVKSLEDVYGVLSQFCLKVMSLTFMDT